MSMPYDLSAKDAHIKLNMLEGPFSPAVPGSHQSSFFSRVMIRCTARWGRGTSQNLSQSHCTSFITKIRSHGLAKERPFMLLLMNQVCFVTPGI